MTRVLPVCGTITVSLMLASCSGALAQLDGNWIGGISGEGYSSSARDVAIHVEYRMFTVTSHECAGVKPPARLQSNAKTIVLARAQRFSLNDLTVRAMDSSGQFIGRAPIHAYVYYATGVLDRTDPAGQEYAAAAPGRGMVILQSLCGDPQQRPARVEIPITVEGAM